MIAEPPTAEFTTARLEAFFDACNLHDVDLIAGFFTPDGVYLASVGPDDDGTVFRGVDAVRSGFDAFFRRYPDGLYTDIDLAVYDSRGVAQWTFTASTPGGPTMSYRGVDLFQFDGDRISLKDAFRKERSQPIGS
ncbi:MAG TPA: nuclear transport factor 2 family protein [Acidimicrobiia bacterium]|nr:nuclear transport factor 2 family protein [Acidimicrobiia bacterium]